MKTWCLFCADIESDCATTVPLCAVTKIVTFNTVLMVLKIVALLYNGHLCFFNGDRFEVINTTLVLCIPVILSIDHVSSCF